MLNKSGLLTSWQFPRGSFLRTSKASETFQAISVHFAAGDKPLRIFSWRLNLSSVFQANKKYFHFLNNFFLQLWADVRQRQPWIIFFNFFKCLTAKPADDWCSLESRLKCFFPSFASITNFDLCYLVEVQPVSTSKTFRLLGWRSHHALVMLGATKWWSRRTFMETTANNRN